MTTTPRAAFDTAARIATFVNAGHATFTIVSKATKARFTYMVRESDDGKVQFVSVLTGSNNTEDFTYLGTMHGGRFTHGRKSRISADAPSAIAFNWFAHALYMADQKRLEKLEFYHEGKCGRCNRKLTVPSSIESGFGPECSGKIMCEAA